LYEIKKSAREEQSIKTEQLQPGGDHGHDDAASYGGGGELQGFSARTLASVLAARIWRACCGIVLLMLIFSMSYLAVIHTRQTLSVTKPEKANSKDEERESLWSGSTWMPVTSFTGALVLVGAGQAALFYWQLKLMRASTRDTTDAASAAMKSAEAASRQLSLVERLERPWVFFVPPAFGKIGYRDSNRADLFPGIDFSLRNYGRSPALIEVTEIAVAVRREPPIRQESSRSPYFEGNSGHPKDRYYFVGHKWTDPVIPPGECLGRSDLQELTVSEAEQADLVTGAQRLWIDGRVTYSDVFGQRRQTQFRYSYDYTMDILVQEGGTDFNWQT